MSCIPNLPSRPIVIAMAMASAFLLSSCLQISNPLSRETKTASRQAGEPVEADRKFKKAEGVAFKKEKKAEKAEDKNFERMKKELEADRAEAMADPKKNAYVSRLFFDKEVLEINERVHSLSKRMEKLSERIHKLSEHLDNLPSKLAALEQEVEKTEQNVKKMSGKPTASAKPKAKTKNSKPFWGIQLGAYKTRPGAEEAWSDILADPMAVELSNAKVHYVPSKPLKNGTRLTLIVVNEFPSHKAADTACNALKTNGLDCVAYHVKP